MLISDTQVLIYNNSDGAVSSNNSIIDASKLGLYGSAITSVADFAQSSSVTTYMASILGSQVILKAKKGNKKSLKVTEGL